jgi:hypothetical protein
MQHRFHNAIGARAVLVDFCQVGFDVAQDGGGFGGVFIFTDLLQFFQGFVDHFEAHIRKIVHEIERVFDFVGDAGGELTQ